MKTDTLRLKWLDLNTDICTIEDCKCINKIGMNLRAEIDKMIYSTDTNSDRIKHYPNLNVYTLKGNVWLEIRKDEGDMWGIYATDTDKLVFGSNQLDRLKAILLLMG